MKKLLFTLFVAILFSACNQTEKREIERLNIEIQNLKAKSIEKDAAINDFFRVLNDIESNITLVMQKEQIIAKNAALGDEMQQDTRDRIQNDINTINELMTKNRQSMAYLNKKLQGANFQIDEFKNRLESANNMLQKRDAEVDVLKDRLASLDFSIEELNAALDTLSIEKQALQQELEVKSSELNKAWYAFGTRKELMENDVIERQGGFLGMGRTTSLKADFNEQYFTKVDITSTDIIPLFTKKASLVTSHPTNSYTLNVNDVGIVESITITKANTFWSVSKYLVIIVD